ncbi:YezD family protein [Nitrosomonas communis]|uniref:YezD family protein n=1 Tax=Nitrosomonas communis TaxID=44574 RepID=UPI003D288E87
MAVKVRSHRTNTLSHAMIPNTAPQSSQLIPQDIKQEILRAIARIQFGSVEIIIHDGQVMQIECREKIRVRHADPIQKTK